MSAFCFTLRDKLIPRLMMLYYYILDLAKGTKWFNGMSSTPPREAKNMTSKQKYNSNILGLNVKRYI